MGDIMNGVVLADNECIVAIDDCGTEWILAKSEEYRATDVLPECSAEDNGFYANWDKGLSVGVYLLTLRPWSAQTYDGEWDCGIDVLSVKPLWVVGS